MSVLASQFCCEYSLALRCLLILAIAVEIHARRLQPIPGLHASSVPASNGKRFRPCRRSSSTDGVALLAEVPKGSLSSTAGSCYKLLMMADDTQSAPVDNLEAPRLEPYPFQEKAIERLLSAGSRGLLLADEMGLGKTVSVIGALNRDSAIKRILIIAPKSVISVWRLELSRWLERPLSVGVVSAAKGMPKELVDILLINYEVVRKYREELDELAPWDVVVCDEAHYLKNPDTIRTQAILGDTYKATNDTYAPCPGALETERVWFLSGSPILNNPIELFPLLRSLDPFGETVPTVRSFQLFEGQYSYQITRRGKTWRGARNTPELRRLLRGDKDRAPLMLRRTKAQVLVDLPQKRYSMIPVVDEAVVRKERRMIQEEQQKSQDLRRQPSNNSALMVSESVNLKELKVPQLKEHLRHACLSTQGTKEQLIARLQRAKDNSNAPARTSSSLPPLPSHEELENVIAAWMSAPPERAFEMSGLDMDKDKIFGILARARHQTALEKVPLAIELLESASAAHKVVVFAHHRDVQSKLCNAFKGAAVTINGDTKPEERAEVVRRFQEDDAVRIFVGSIRAAGVGITLTAASHVLFVEFDWSPMIMQQAEDRCHRIGQLDSVLIQYLYFEGTVDEMLASSLSRKLTGISASLDGSMGNSTAYTFDFGKHDGETLLDVAATTPGYLDWLVENGVHEKRPKLREALKALGKLPNAISSLVGSDEEENSEEDHRKVIERDADACVRDLEYVFDFGKYSGEDIKHVEAMDPEYLYWLSSSGAAAKRPALLNALRVLGMSLEDASVMNEEEELAQVLAPAGTEAVEYPGRLPEDISLRNKSKEGEQPQVPAPAGTEAVEYVFSSGKHKGEKLVDVVRTDPQYLDLLIMEDVHKTRPRLSDALRASGYLQLESE